MDSDSDSEEQPGTVRGIPATIILINVFDPYERKSSGQAHVATCLLIRNYLRTQSTHHLAVSVYGTDDDNTSIFAMKCVKNIFPLSPPTLDNYKTLKELQLDSMKQSKELVLSEVLAHCSKMFTECKKTLSSRSIIMLTALDQPPAVYDQQPTLNFVEDLCLSNIYLKVINVANHDYKIDQFYMDFLLEANKGQDTVLPECVWDSEDIKKQLIIQSHRHLAVAELPFEVCKDVTMGVKIYKLLTQSKTGPKTTYLHRETTETITSTTKVMKYTKGTDMDVDQDEQKQKFVSLLKTEVLQCQEYGDELLEFTYREMNFIKNTFGSNRLKLLGFKPANVIQKEKWYVENCYFLYPSEEKIEGSTIAFKALYHACIEMKVVAICIMRVKVNSRPRLVALFPCSRPFGLNADIGFDVIIVPYAENVRDLPVVEDNDDTEITNEHKTMMNGIINGVIFDYKPEMFENPVLKSKYNIIEAKALESTHVDEVHDTTKPDEKMFESLDDDQFYKMFGPFNKVIKKRVNESNESSTSQKKTKSDFTIDEDVLRENIANNNVHKKYTVEQLRQILRSKNISFNAKKKDDLVKLVNENFT